MAATLSTARSKFPADRWPTEPSAEAMIHPVDLDRRTKQPSLGKRALRRLARFLIVLCIGVAATLAWQSYGDAAREMIASSSPQLSWLAPQAIAQSAPNIAAPTVPAAPSADVQQLQKTSLDLAALRQSLDQIAAGQQQMTDGIAKLQAVEQDILNKISVPSPQPATAPARKPVAVTPPPPSQAPPVR